MDTRKVILFSLCVSLLALAAGCSTQKRVRSLGEQEQTVTIRLPEEHDIKFREIVDERKERDTLVVTDLDGNEVTLMETLVDEDGNAVAHETLKAARVVARFRNVAERNGNVSIEFEILVPRHFMDSKWQVRFHPDMYIQQDTVRLDPLLITGNGYRDAQLRGYELYNRFINSIITDSTRFVWIDALEVFLQRNIPEVFQFKTDSTYVSEETFYSYYGVSQRKAVDHYTRKWIVRRNDRREGRRDRMYDKYVKSPIVYEGVKLDTVITDIDGDVTYRYTHSFRTRPKLRKVEIVLSGEIYEIGERIYTIPDTEPLTFYISSLNAFTRDIVRYKTKIIERKVEANTRADIVFGTGRWNVDPELGGNAGEISKIKDILASLADNEEFDIDSIVVNAYASPEGRESDNRNLSRRRSSGVSEYFSGWLDHVCDSIDAARGFSVDEHGNIVVEKRTDIRFISHDDGEDWVRLDTLVRRDTVMTREQKDDYFALAVMPDRDSREREMASRSYYRHVRENLYPRLRSVRFDFHMHRKGMVKDTVHTTVVDTAYMEGVQALRDMDYETALLRLRPYDDYNTAVAYCATGRNASALSILEGMERDAQVNYMLAVIYSRESRMQEAVQCYMHACRQDPSYVHRGNLDPEISDLIQRYGLNKEEEIPTDF